MIFKANIFFLNYGTADYRKYSINRYFLKRGNLNSFFYKSNKYDSYRQKFVFIPRKRFTESIPQYNRVNGRFLKKYLNYSITNKFSEYKALPKFTVSVNGGNYFYFNRISKILGNTNDNIKPHFFFCGHLNKWSRNILVYENMLRFFKRKTDNRLLNNYFIEWVNNYNVDRWKSKYSYRKNFMKNFDFHSPIDKNNLNNWIVLKKKEYDKIINQINYLLYDTSGKIMYDNKQFCKKIHSKYIFKLKKKENINSKDSKDSKDSFFLVHLDLIKFIRSEFILLLNIVKKYLITINTNKKHLLKKNKKKIYKYIGRKFINNYIGRRFAKKHLKFWEFHRAYRGWIFNRKPNKWNTFYIEDFKIWFYKRKCKWIKFRRKLYKKVKLSIIKSMNLSLNNSNVYPLILHNRIYFIKQIKSLLYLMTKKMAFFDVKKQWYLANKMKANFIKNINKKEILFIILYLSRVCIYDKIFFNIIKKFKDMYYNNSFVITKKIKHQGNMSNYIINTLVALMHKNKGSTFDISWDDFIPIRERRFKHYKFFFTNKKLRRFNDIYLGRDPRYIEKYSTYYKSISTLYRLRYTKYKLDKNYVN